MAKWIQGAIKHPGAFTASAKAAGQSVHSFAEEKQHAGGTLGRRARLALTLEGMHSGHSKGENKGSTMQSDRKNRLKSMLSSRTPKERDNSSMMAAANKARMGKSKKY